MGSYGLTYLQITNRVLARLREAAVATVSETIYSTFITTLINQVKGEIEAAWYWQALRDTFSITTVTTVTSYAFTGAGSDASVLDGWNTTTPGLLERGTNDDFDSYYYGTTSIQTGSVTKYIPAGVDANYDLKIDVWPKPVTGSGAGETLKFVVYKPQADLSNDADIPLVPQSVLIEEVIARALNERGDDMAPKPQPGDTFIMRELLSTRSRATPDKTRGDGLGAGITVGQLKGHQFSEARLVRALDAGHDRVQRRAEALQLAGVESCDRRDGQALQPRGLRAADRGLRRHADTIVHAPEQRRHRDADERRGGVIYSGITALTSRFDYRSGCQMVDVGGAKTGATARASRTPRRPTPTRSRSTAERRRRSRFSARAAQTYTNLLTEINTDITGRDASLIGGNLVFTSTSTGATSTIALTSGGGGTNLLTTLTSFVAVRTATAGTTTNNNWQFATLNSRIFAAQKRAKRSSA
jgi:hypothetical protein